MHIISNIKAFTKHERDEKVNKQKKKKNQNVGKALFFKNEFSDFRYASAESVRRDKTYLS